MNIPELIREAHENAVERGFYDCPVCHGRKCSVEQHIFVDCDSNCIECLHGCKTCKGTGIDPNRNIGNMLMDIIAELVGAFKAHRCGRFANESALVIHTDFPEKHHQKEALYLFETQIKDTFEDKIADVFIRLFDLCGYLELNKNDVPVGWGTPINVSDNLFYLAGGEPHLFNNNRDSNYHLNRLFKGLFYFCHRHGIINIEKHIKAKMAYNKTRPRKHGKEY